jgi:TolB-like protein
MSGAVFLSYASQDAEAARRICDALRAAGVEVWFDQSELRGGDSWDQKIRRQIRECALFIPVISANTQSRSEGYFRREWKLAAERTHDMADHVTFIVPVVLDATPDHEAHVPELFRQVQWTRLPGGETSAGFAQRVKDLLHGVSEEEARRTSTAPSYQTFAPTARRARRRRLVPAAAAVLAGAALASWAIWTSMRLGAPAGAPSMRGELVPRPPGAAGERREAAAEPDPGSVAVLPFKNLSDDKENEYFSDGISEELLTVLQKIPGLRVAAQTSAFFFKGKNVMTQEIGRQLHVANLVEGSVQKSGNRVRITARLSRAATGEEIWAVSLPPREMTDVFALQDEIAQSIVAQLKSRLGAADDATTKADIEAQVQAAEIGGTKDPAAHELYLQGLYLVRQFTSQAFVSAEGRFRQAVQIDPSYALAWAALSKALGFEWGWTSVSSTAAIGEWRESARRSLELEPRLVDGYNALFILQVSYDLDLAGAAATVRKALELSPGNAEAVADAGMLALVNGHTDRALTLLKQAKALDPLHAEYAIFYAEAFYSAGRLDDGLAECERILSLNPDASLVRGFEATALALHNTRLAEALELANHEKEEWSRLSAQALCFWGLKKYPEADEALKRLIETNANTAAYQVAEVYSFRHETDKAFEWLERAHRQHDAGLTWLKIDDAFKPIRSDPRWADFLHKTHLADPEPNQAGQPRAEPTGVSTQPERLLDAPSRSAP